MGSFFLDSSPAAGVAATGGHLWNPLVVLKDVFHQLKIPASQQIYALSFYEHHKCSDAGNLSCTDLDPHDWASQSLKSAVAEVGKSQAGHLLMTEGGTGEPGDWPSQFAFESIGVLMQKYRLPGGNFWRWAAFFDGEEADPATESGGQAVKMRGVDFVYFPPQKEVVDLGGFHLASIPNGSFEQGSVNKAPSQWSVSGDGMGIKYFLAGEPNEPQVPSRGNYDLRLTTGSDSQAVVVATSKSISVVPNMTYTTASNLRFGWSGDPNPSGDPTTRPQVFVTFNYFSSPNKPSASKSQDSFRYFQENSTNDFQTFPFQYTTPSDAKLVQIVIGAARNGLPTPIVLDADNLR